MQNGGVFGDSACAMYTEALLAIVNICSVSPNEVE